MSPLDSPRPAVLFAEDFDLPATIEDTVPEPEIIAPTFTASDIEAARRDAWDAGHAAGMVAAESTSAALARAALPDLTAVLGAATGQVREAVEEAADGLAQMLVNGLAALFPAMAAAHGAMETRAVVAALLPVLRQEPRATIRVAPTLAAAMAAEVAALGADLAERVAVIPDPVVPPGDVRASWTAGTAVRDARAAWREVAAILAQAGWAPAAEPERVLADVE